MHRNLARRNVQSEEHSLLEILIRGALAGHGRLEADSLVSESGFSHEDSLLWQAVALGVF